MTLAEQMALCVLKGDMVAAYALADALVEERERGLTTQAQVAKELSEQTSVCHDGYSVYRWPEFQAFCRRAGFLWDLRTIKMTIYINEGERLRIDHQYAGSDDQRANTSSDRPPDLNRDKS